MPRKKKDPTVRKAKKSKVGRKGKVDESLGANNFVAFPTSDWGSSLGFVFGISEVHSPLLNAISGQPAWQTRSVHVGVSGTYLEDSLGSMSRITDIHSSSLNTLSGQPAW